MFSTDLDAYTWAFQNLWSQTTHSMVIGLDPGISGYLRDYAVANNCLVMFLDPGTSGELALLEQVFSAMPQGCSRSGPTPRRRSCRTTSRPRPATTT